MDGQQGGRRYPPSIVLVEGQSITIAFEIADSSPLDQEVRNIEKALNCGIDSVVVISDSSPHFAEIQQAAKARGISIEKVTFMESDSIGGYFASLGATLASYETTSRGYRVRVHQAGMSEREREERLAAIHRAIAEHQKDNQLKPE
ncbi:hypothetical protein JIN84_21410 [Luteolibacter yonseiensis]|uniref:Uncharacterized protein n=1 Tax=Luteolibacter yonseiensis TaxID=1144680 RepID=A0A934VDM8_9BACT|nr:hypothetical protein [Luteolibacter yonseiensis]MBK1818196.1 hypothetical protein [Luteolibacter yonseiensis]